MERPIIAITMGDAAGIGPELIAKVLADPATYDFCRPVVIGSAEVMGEAVALTGGAASVRRIASVAEAAFTPGSLDVIEPEGLRVPPLPPGTLDAALGEAAACCMRDAFRRGEAGEVQGVVLAPMNKQAFHLAGYHYLDELEYLAEITGHPEAFLLGAISPALWTIAVTLHVPFRAIPDLITTARVREHIAHLDGALRRIGIAAPRIAVAALNVHGGEGGMFGREEIDVIAPAIAAAQADGIAATGPWPADTVFVRARAGEFDGVACMYHDQANIARKLLATRDGATIYMGLPVVAGTTAHGTAFDIAGKGIGDPRSLAATARYVSMLSGATR